MDVRTFVVIRMRRCQVVIRDIVGKARFEERKNVIERWKGRRMFFWVSFRFGFKKMVLWRVI